MLLSPFSTLVSPHTYCHLFDGTGYYLWACYRPHTHTHTHTQNTNTLQRELHKAGIFVSYSPRSAKSLELVPDTDT